MSAPADGAWAERIARHGRIEEALRSLSDADLLRLLAGSPVHDRGHGIRALPGGGEAFVKLVPLTALEMEPRHRHSTANLFRLPPSYQYRLGSFGFGAWREWEAHRMAHRWVVDGESPGFPLLHGWRVLPIAARRTDDRADMKPWAGDPAVRRRVAAIAEAASSVALLLEPFPSTLERRFKVRPLPAAETEAALLELLSFTGGRGFLHMDAHFGNLLTDGRVLVLGDLGLATSTAFDLDPAEREFLERHRNFDACTALTGLVRAVSPRAEEERSFLARRRPLARAMGEFLRRCAADPSTEYPAPDLQRLLELD